MLRVNIWLLLLIACDTGNTASVRVDLITDYVPGVEFSRVETTVNGTDVTPHMVGDGEYLTGVRVAEIAAESDVTMRVSLIRTDGRVLVSRQYTDRFADLAVLTVVFTRNCESIRCSEEQACLDGVCTDPGCSPANPAACPEGLLCATSTDCTGTSAACAPIVCQNGLCLPTPNDSCRSGEYCNPDLGCQPTMSVDGGIPDGATSDGCVAGAPCERDALCEVGVIACEDGVPTCELAGVADAGTICRPEAGECDFAEICDGNSGECPGDARSTDLCRASTGPCDVEESCDGMDPACPEDVMQPAGAACDGGFCNGLSGDCQSGCTPGAPCSTGNACERGGLDCTMGTPMCMSTGDLPNGTVCGAQSCGGWGACGGFSNGCDLTGTQSRSCTDRLCAAGSCGSSPSTMTRACSRTLTETCDLTDDDCDGSCDEGCRVPVYRFYSGGVGDHFYSRSSTVPPGYVAEGIEFYVYPGPRSELIAYYRCLNGADHFLSPSSTCEGRTVEGVLGYVRSGGSPRCNSIPLYRYYSASANNHFYTRSSTTPPGYVFESINAQVWTN